MIAFNHTYVPEEPENELPMHRFRSVQATLGLYPPTPPAQYLNYFTDLESLDEKTHTVPLRIYAANANTARQATRVLAGFGGSRISHIPDNGESIAVDIVLPTRWARTEILSHILQKDEGLDATVYRSLDDDCAKQEIEAMPIKVWETQDIDGIDNVVCRGCD